MKKEIYSFWYRRKLVEERLEYAITIIQNLLDNSDEYVRERAINFLKENEHND